MKLFFYFYIFKSNKNYVILYIRIEKGVDKYDRKFTCTKNYR